MDDRSWLRQLKRSVHEPLIDGVEYPKFPHPDLQATFVGSADEKTLDEAFDFYVLTKAYMRKLGRPLTLESNFLDFGCGWGRFLRFFWKDVNPERLYGCDVNPDIVNVCRELAVPGRIDVIRASGALPYPDAFFDGVMAYSVFTHLPREEHLLWMRELARVSRSGSVFCLTLEPRRFLDFIGQVPDDSPVHWYRRLGTFKDRLPGLVEAFDRGEVAFIPTNPGVEATYGDAAVPISFVREHWGPYFRIVDYVDDPNRFWQAVLVVQRL
jgi:SAM-dependent methyltransferase